MDDDNINNNANSYIGGIVLQDIDTVLMYNNAVAMLDESNQSDIVAPIVIQSVRPNNPGTLFDINNNIYFSENNVIIRFIEQSARNPRDVSRPGSKFQYTGLEQ